jgi:hypothetical protein
MTNAVSVIAYNTSLREVTPRTMRQGAVCNTVQQFVQIQMHLNISVQL